MNVQEQLEVPVRIYRYPKNILYTSSLDHTYKIDFTVVYTDRLTRDRRYTVVSFQGEDLETELKALPRGQYLILLRVVTEALVGVFNAEMHDVRGVTRALGELRELVQR